MFYLTSVHDFSPTFDAENIDGCILKIADGDYDALEALYNNTKASVYGYALSILKNTFDAEDVLHDVYVSIFSSAQGYFSHGKPLAWILTITRNLCLMKIREHKRKADMPEENWEAYLDNCERMSTLDKLVITECMKSLSDEERQIVALHAVSGFKHREIALFLQMPLSTVLSKYNRAIKKLRIIYKEDGENER